ncbi:MAG TPA: hypothetical protein VMV86_03305 [Methanosarcinales archaeon]|nr:hypothetical protein [Methanosarcinales archaeon]
MGWLIWFIAGIIAASAIWFFVWRNNKTLIQEQAQKLDDLVNSKLDKKDEE